MGFAETRFDMRRMALSRTVDEIEREVGVGRRLTDTPEEVEKALLTPLERWSSLSGCSLHSCLTASDFTDFIPGLHLVPLH
jgi:hypothetical protein